MSSRFYDVIIIGGGAAGLFTAAQLPESISAAVIECNERVGKKLLATGNGKCNLTNLEMIISHYNAPSFVESFLDRFDAHDAIRAFEEMGLITKVIDKRVYPYSECASTVLDVLRRAAQIRGTEFLTSHSANKITADGEGFSVSGVKKEKDKPDASFSISGANVVLSTGSPATFGRDSLNLYTALGHTKRDFTASLTPIKTEKEPIKGLQGVRVKAGVRIGHRYEVGEVLFKDFGISGIAVFNLASEIARGRVRPDSELTIDLMPESSLADVEGMLFRRGDVSVGELLTGTFHSKVVERIKWAAHAADNDRATDKARAVAFAIKNYTLRAEGLGDASLAQVMSGGLNVREFDENLMSLKVKGAYAAGEALDVDGDSGGYNLQWAWSSAKAVADSIKRNLIK